MTCAETFNSLANVYDTYFSGITSIKENEKLFECIKTNHLSTGHVLDVGCGTGLFLEYINQTHYTGVDIAEKMLENARKKFPSSCFIHGDMHNMPFSDNSFDGVFSLFGVFSYSPTPTKVIAQSFRVLKTGKKIFIMCFKPSYKSKSSHIIVKYNTPTFFRTYSDIELKELFVQQGFKDVQITEFDGYFWIVTGWK